MTAVSVAASGAAADAVSSRVPALVEDRVASRLFEQDPTLWGEAAESEASVRLSWTGLGVSSRPLVDEIVALHDDLRARGLSRVVLCGMGGSSLAPEVICATEGLPLVVLDSSHPDVVRDALVELESTVAVVSSKSGSTVETDSQLRVFEAAFTQAGIDPAERIVVVTDPGSPMDEDSTTKGYRVFRADPDVGGRYSALTAFGLVPSGLAGVDVGQLLDDAEAATEVLSVDDDSNPGLLLGAALGGSTPLRDKVALVDAGTSIRGLGAWAEQLIAESTGKEGTGLLPVVVAPPGPSTTPADMTIVRLVDEDEGTEVAGSDGSAIEVSGSLGAQFLLWETAVAVAGRILEINPFDQPDVESAKEAARTLLGKGSTSQSEPSLVDGDVEVRALGGPWLGDADSLAEAVVALLGQVGDGGYVAVMAYLDRQGDAELEGVTGPITQRVGRPTTFGWGPRFLHSTGQYHKGGPRTGVYIQVTAAPEQDLAVPGRDFSFGQVIAAQAAGDAQVLADLGRPVLRLHLTDHDRGLDQVTAALGAEGAG